ncbi:TonB family protein [Herbaspirillum robiniae]|uniref:TonB C-terminal domain-containing protein n=1 Tax=Herbaspirillum robiniae TaxID=2014887 RepID=A0A246WPD6_9BURK|nr:TonB family protein [Herbaspirillum robiniae]OWY28218.1 hypothetical protein CEJ42_16550 [Herbaspirillum robiniae]
MTHRPALPAALSLAALLLIPAALPLAAQNLPAPDAAPAAAPAPIQLNPRATLPITPEEKKNIDDLLRASGAINVGKVMARLFASQVTTTLKSSRPNLPPHVAGVVNEEIARAVSESIDAPDGLADMLAQLYHKYFTDEEIRQMTAFYNSPAGQKSVQVMPVLLPESQNLGRAWGAKLAPVVLQRVEARLKAEAAAGNAPGAAGNGTPQASAEQSAPSRRLEIAVAPRPVYPADSRASREEGTVRMKVQVNRSGQVQDVAVLISSGYPRLDAAAIQAVRGMSYKPFAGDQDTMSAEVNVAFKLGNQQPQQPRPAGKDQSREI